GVGPSVAATGVCPGAQQQPLGAIDRFSGQADLLAQPQNLVGGRLDQLPRLRHQIAMLEIHRPPPWGSSGLSAPACSISAAASISTKRRSTGFPIRRVYFAPLNPPYGLSIAFSIISSMRNPASRPSICSSARSNPPLSPPPPST